MARPNVSAILPKSALVVDTDSVVLQLIRNHLSDMGVPVVHISETGTEAWKVVQKDKPEMVVMDWKLPGVSGVCLYNRLRQTLNMANKPVLAISGTMVRDDFRLLEEYPCTAFLAKPFSRQVLQEDLERLQADYLWLRQHTDQIDQILSRISRDGSDSIKQMKAILTGSPNPVPIALIAATKLREYEFVPEAEQLLRQILKIAPHSILAMNELGKMLHLQGRHREALEILEKANNYSPKNLARLCLNGEVQLNVGDPAHARESFRQALEIDPDSERAQQGMLLANNIVDYVGNKAADKATMPHQFASLLNTIGINKVRSGQFEEGIKQYRAAVAFVHSKDIAARLSFNVALAYLRAKRLNEAMTWFSKAWELSDGKMIKVKKYLKALNGKVGGPQIVKAPSIAPEHELDLGNSHSSEDEILADGSELEIDEAS